MASSWRELSLNIMSLPLPLSWGGTASSLDYQTGSTWSSFHSCPLSGTCDWPSCSSVLYLIFPIHEHNSYPCPSNSIIPQPKLLRIGIFSLMFRSKPLCLELTWPLPFQAMPYLLRKDPPGRAHRNGHKLLSFQNSLTTTFKFLYLLPTNQLFLREIVPFKTNKISSL